MNRIMNKAKKNITNQKKKYVFLGIIMLLGLISGLLFIFFIAKEDKLLITNQLESFFAGVNGKKINYMNSFINSITSNILYLLVIWLLGVSIVGIPIIIFMIFFKGFIFGFSFSSIVVNFGIRGFFGALVYHFPHQLILLPIWLLIGFYSTNFSIKLFRLLFFKEDINLSHYFKRYIQVLGVCLIGVLICSLLEVFLTPFLINLVM